MTLQIATQEARKAADILTLHSSEVDPLNVPSRDLTEALIALQRALSALNETIGLKNHYEGEKLGS